MFSLNPLLLHPGAEERPPTTPWTLDLYVDVADVILTRQIQAQRGGKMTNSRWGTLWVWGQTL